MEIAIIAWMVFSGAIGLTFGLFLGMYLAGDRTRQISAENQFLKNRIGLLRNLLDRSIKDPKE